MFWLRDGRVAENQSLGFCGGVRPQEKPWKSRFGRLADGWAGDVKTTLEVQALFGPFALDHNAGILGRRVIESA